MLCYYFCYFYLQHTNLLCYYFCHFYLQQTIVYMYAVYCSKCQHWRCSSQLIVLLKPVSTWNKLLIDRLYHCAVGTEQEAATELLRNKPNSSVAAVLGQEPWSILVRLGNHSVKNHKQISETKNEENLFNHKKHKI